MPSTYDVPEHLKDLNEMPPNDHIQRLLHYKEQAAKHHALNEVAEVLGDLLDALSVMCPIIGMGAGAVSGELVAGNSYVGGLVGWAVGLESGPRLMKAAESLHMYAMTTGDHSAKPHAELLAHASRLKAGHA